MAHENYFNMPTCIFVTKNSAPVVNKNSYVHELDAVHNTSNMPMLKNNLQYVYDRCNFNIILLKNYQSIEIPSRSLDIGEELLIRLWKNVTTSDLNYCNYRCKIRGPLYSGSIPSTYFFLSTKIIFKRMECC